MKQYIGTKIVEAEPANKVNGKVVQPTDWPVPHDATVEEGYTVHYAGGYESWSPKGVFERAYLPIEVNADLKPDQPSISQKMVDDFIAEVHVTALGEKTTVVRVVLVNDFEIVEASSCVSPKNYSEELGKEICLERIKGKVWMLLGFLLQTGVSGVKK